MYLGSIMDGMMKVLLFLLYFLIICISYFEWRSFTSSSQKLLYANENDAAPCVWNITGKALVFFITLHVESYELMLRYGLL